MKIEIDFSKPEALRKQKRELEMALLTIDSALTALGKNGRDADQSLQPSLPQMKEAQSTAVAGTVEEIVALMPSQFSMREAKAAADVAEIPDSRLRREIAQMVEAGALILAEKGQGRRPASFRKA
jgi:hypothetical protein